MRAEHTNLKRFTIRTEIPVENCKAKTKKDSGYRSDGDSDEDIADSAMTPHQQVYIESMLENIRKSLNNTSIIDTVVFNLIYC